MDLFNAFITETNEQLGAPKQKWAYSERDAWKDLGTSELVLMKDAAFELGASGKVQLKKANDKQNDHRAQPVSEVV